MEKSSKKIKILIKIVGIIEILLGIFNCLFLFSMLAGIGKIILGGSLIKLSKKISYLIKEKNGNILEMIVNKDVPSIVNLVIIIYILNLAGSVIMNMLSKR